MSHPSFIKMHPLVAAAAASVIIVSLVGTAAIMDWLPSSKGKEAPAMSATVPPTSEPSEATKQSNEAAAAAAKALPPRATAPSRKPATQSAAATQSTPSPVVQAPPICAVCGKVVDVRTVEVAAKPSGVGVVAGAVVGGLLGNQVGGGSGKTLATVAGAVGGGYAGNEIEKRTRKGSAWEVDVRMENGETKAFRYDTQPSWRTGDRVKVVDGTLAAN